MKIRKNYKRLMVVFVVYAIGVAFAEPIAIGTKSEIQAARGLIEDLVQSGTGADELLTMAADSTKGAERYWLYANAFILQAKEGKYAEATETVKSLRANVTGIPDAELAGLIGRNAGKGLSEAPELEAILKETKVRIAAQKLAVQLKQNIRKNPKDDSLKESLADTMAVCGDWDAALKAYAETKLASASTAKAELARKTSAKVAAFWWDYKPCRALSATTAFKAHAVEIYTELTKDGALSALEKTLAEKRIVQFSEMVKAGEEKGGVSEKPQIKKLSADVKKNELAELKKICNTKGLVHCWRFNGNLGDCVCNEEAKIVGDVEIDQHQVNIEGTVKPSYIELGPNLIPTDGSPVTLEIWASSRGPEDDARIFGFGRCFGLHCAMKWWNTPQFYVAGRAGVAPRDGLGSFDLNTEYHICVVFIPSGNQDWTMKAYRQDANTGKTLFACQRIHPGWSLMGFPMETFHLGLNSRAPTSYNEVRIWNRALDEKELTQNAIRFHKAGETMKPNK